LGRKVWRVDSTLVVKHDLPFGKSYLYAPQCGADFLSKSFIKKIKEIAKKEGAIFFKIEPSKETKKTTELKKLGFKKGQIIQPDKTSILDISDSEEKILRGMHHKTRYNIKLAEKKGVIVKQSNSEKDLEEFWRLLQQTTKRDGFNSHPKEYYRKLLKIPNVTLFLALSKEKVVATNIVAFHKEQGIYLHGTSDYKYRNLMAPYLLQWKQIVEAKEQGCLEYDFWGIDEKKWPGVTRFKRGFQGQEVFYLGAYDLVFQKIWYWIYKIARKIL
jgi:lipid II:glycine glycyltransferase (peptidoglycan interpeptide bridge formation enzyme)